MSAATSDHDTPSRARISGLADPLGWRLILGVLITHLPVPSLAAAADAAGVAVAAASPDAEGHLSADLHADRVVLRLQTRAVGAITGRDLRMASQISAAVSARGWPTLPGAAAVPQLLEIAIDAMDIAAIRPFWQAVTGYLDEPAAPELPNALVDPLRRGPAIWFQQMDTPPAAAQPNSPRCRCAGRAGAGPGRGGAGRRRRPAQRCRCAFVLGTG